MALYDFYQVEIKGVAPLLMHNGRLADPANEFVLAGKSITGKRKKVPADHEELANLEFRGGLYTERGEIIFPSRLLEANLAEGAKVSREGKIALSGMFVEPDAEFTYAGPTGIEERIADPECRLVVGVRVGTSRVMRCRPIFKDWSIKFRVSVLHETVSESMLQGWLENAGMLKGLGDWRPRNGRYSLVSLEKTEG